LVVDDDVAMRRMLQRILEGAGCEVVTAAGTADVARILGASDARFDSAVVDLRLADGRGISVVAALRAHETPCSALVITGYADERAAHESIAAGADDFLLKPFSAQQILAAVVGTIEKTARWREKIVPGLMLAREKRRLSYRRQARPAAPGRKAGSAERLRAAEADARCARSRSLCRRARASRRLTSRERES